MAGSDIAMNELTTATNAEYIYAEAANGSQVKIKKADLVELIRANMSVATQDAKGLMSNNDIIYLGKVQNDLTNAGSSFGYSYDKDGSEIAGPYLSLEGTNGYIFQLKVSARGNELKFRTYHNDYDEWSSWKSVSFTG